MPKYPINLTTLGWVDRRRLWATTSRLTALGVNKVPVYPSTLTGQSSRPTVANRYFAVSWSWLVSSGLVCLSLGLATSASVAAFSLALNIAFRALTLGLDKSTNCAKEAPLFVEKLDVRGTRPLTEEARLFSTGSARALYSLLGSMDTVAPFLTAPTFTLKVPNRWGLFTEPALPTCWGLGVGKDNLAKPSFRPYLGEWRRLLDQPTSAKASGAGAAYLNRTKQNYNPLRPAVRRPAVAPKGGFRPLADAATKPYYVYLTSPWVF